MLSLVTFHVTDKCVVLPTAVIVICTSWARPYKNSWLLSNVSMEVGCATALTQALL